MGEKGTSSGEIERRRFLQQTATVAFASPVIVSMMTGAARAQAQECGEKIGGAGTTACTVTNACDTGFECLGAPLLGSGTPCGCVPNL